MSSKAEWHERFHQAAKDGNMELLSKANRKDANLRDEDGMTPTLWAAYYGNLAALRKVIERGGNPDKCDHLGNTALHCAASRGHFNCVSYLINFGCNLWAMDNSHRSAMDLASLHDRQDIVKLLDQARANERHKNAKNARKLQEAAVLDADARIKEFEKRQRKLHDKMRTGSSSNYMSQSAPAPRTEPSTSTSASGKTDPVFAPQVPPRPVLSSTGGQALLLPRAQSATRKTHPSGWRPDDAISLAPSDMTFRSDSGYGDDDIHSPGQFPIRSGLPGFTRAFLPKMQPLQAENLYSLSMDGTTRRVLSQDLTEEDDRYPGPSSSSRQAASGWRQYDLTDEESEEEGNDQDLKMFLTGNGLGKLYPLFQKKEIDDVQTLLLLSETDLEKVGIELGSRKRLMQAVLRYRVDLDTVAEITDSRL
ncbi:hypothetical protein RvY_01716 [Ramazzottius varieornatus]|uniref:SAM domain-containing protein n=1 Tax=Ramazzottius varieornatus TaxID=947166 RepID=A0A1D1USG6_RAMVA|nr:hypothetical protein RvY_01716 [Ramazzottius varieornatus]